MPNQIITSSILIIVVLSIRGLCGKYTGQRFKYALWLIIAAKLIIPMPFENPVNVINYFPSKGNAIRVMDENGSENISDTVTGNTQQLPPVDTPNGQISPADNKAAAKPEASISTAGIKDKVNVIQILQWIWAVGIVIFGGYLLISNIIFSAKLRRKRNYTETYRDALPVYVTPLVHSPCLSGIIKPAIYLPDGWKISETYRDYILLHEWIHYRHKDMVWSLVRCICLTVYWFHPLVWVSCILSRQDCETACDEGVMAELGDGKRADYGRMLVDICAIISRDSRNYLLMQELRGGHREMKSRLSILIQKSSSLPWMILLVTVISVTMAGCTYGRRAVSDKEPAPEKAQQISINEPETEKTLLSIPVTEATPDLTQSTGADGAVLYYADENQIIFGGYFGLFVYDTVNQKMLRSVDLEAIGCSATQGDGYCEIQVSEDGRQVYLHPMNITDMYVYDVEENSLKKETYNLSDISLYSNGYNEGSFSAVYQSSEGQVELWLSHSWAEIGQLGYKKYISGKDEAEPVKKFFVPGEYNTAPLLALSDLHEIKKAEMMLQGRLYLCDSLESLQEMETMLSQAKVIKPTGCPFDDALYLTKEDGSLGVIYPATDSCNVIRTADGYLEFGDSDNSKLWELLGLNPEILW